MPPWDRRGSASLSCPGSYPNGNLYEQKSNHFRDLGTQSLLNLMSISLNFRKVERKRHLESWRRLCILDEGISKPPLQMPAGQACGLLSYRWNPSGVARHGWEGLPVWNRSRRCRWGGGTWVSTSWLPGYIRGSPRSKVATSIGALTSPPAPSDSFACIFCVA